MKKEKKDFTDVKLLDLLDDLGPKGKFIKHYGEVVGKQRKKKFLG